MNNLEKEAEEYTKCKQICSNHIYDKISCYESFIAGANSNYAKQQIIKGKIEVVEDILDNRYTYARIAQLLDELKQLETPKS